MQRVGFKSSLYRTKPHVHSKSQNDQNSKVTDKQTVWNQFEINNKMFWVHDFLELYHNSD